MKTIEYGTAIVNQITDTITFINSGNVYKFPHGIYNDQYDLVWAIGSDDSYQNYTPNEIDNIPAPVLEASVYQKNDSLHFEC